MDYELAALDLDDTLLDPDKKISERNARAVRRAADAGVHIIVASGRAYLGVLPYLKELGLRDYTIATGGSFTMDASGQPVDRDPIAPGTAAAVIRWAQERGIYYQVYVDQGFLYPRRTAYTDRYEHNNGFRGVYAPDLAARSDIAAGKILFIDSAENIARYQKMLRADFPSLLIETSHPTFLEISSEAASKGAALERLCRRLSIPREKVIAIGDSPIDTSMIAWAGLGVAVENAVPEVKQAADYITGPASWDGVADVIERFVLRSGMAAGS